MKHSKLVGAVSNPDLSGSRESGQAGSTHPTVCMRCGAENETTVRRLVGAVSNCAGSTRHGTYAVRLKTTTTGGESVHLFLESP